MTVTIDDANDPILVALWNARDLLVTNFEDAKLIYGDEVYALVMEKLQEEHDELRAKLDNRINRRIMELATR